MSDAANGETRPSAPKLVNAHSEGPAPQLPEAACLAQTVQKVHEEKRAVMQSVYSILLAEDNPADVYLIREALKEHGVDFQLRVASNGKEVMGIVSGEAPQEAGVDAYALVILDVNLPRHSGIEILQRLKESGSARKTPVVVLTSSDSPKDKQMAIALGATCYLKKPSNLDQFLALGSVFKQLLESKPEGAPRED